MVGLRSLRPPVLQHLHDLGDNLPRLLYQHRVPDADVLFGDEVLVVEGGVGDGGARQANRLHHRLGGEHAGAPHLHHDVHHPGGLLLRRILVGRRPPGEFGGRAQDFPLCKAVYLYNSAVDVEGVSLPALPHGFDPLRRLSDSLAGVMWNYFKPLLLQVLQGFRVGGEGAALRPLDVEHPDVQPPGGGDLGIQLPQGARRRIAGVGKETLPSQLPLLVEPLEALLGHEHLPPDNQGGQGLRQAQGDGGDGLKILRHVLPHLAVAPGGPPDKEAVFILQGHGQAVHLGLHVVLHAVGQGLPHPLVELLQLLHGEHVLEALQGNPVVYLLEAVRHLAPHPLGGRVRGNQLRVFGLQLLQTAELVVEAIVGHAGVVQHIVLIVGLLQLPAQGLDLLSLVHVEPPLGSVG